MNTIPDPAAVFERQVPDGPAPQIGIGVICPFDLALDRELWRWVPPNITLHCTRTPFVDEPVGIELAEEVGSDEDVLAAARNLQAVRPELIAYACTSGSFIHGIAGARRISETMVQGGAPRAVNTSEALLAAVEVMGIRNLAVATPYVQELTDLLARFLQEAGCAVTGQSSLGLEGNIWQVPYSTTVELIRAADTADAEAIFVSCTNLPTYDIIAPLEQELGKPVLSANQVTMWAALRALDLAAIGPGQRLLER